MLRGRLRALTRVSVCAVVLVAVGCGGGEGGEEGTPAVSSEAPLGEGGTLVWAVADPVRSLDPLRAATRADQLVSRQVNEPLTAVVRPPFEPERRVRGLARSVSGSGDSTVWTFQLRSGVRFQDGTPFNASAVRANAERWQSTAAGQALVPGISSVAAVTPDEVRFVLAAPDPRFPKRLSDPRLGIVSPGALEPSSGVGAVVTRSANSGTGPFEVRQRGSGSVVLVRNTAWWGTVAAGMGPALDQIEFRTEPSSSVRLALLDAGDAQAADELERSQAELASGDPLLIALRGDESWLGLQRSVRGVGSARQIPALSMAWLSDLSDPG